MVVMKTCFAVACAASYPDPNQQFLFQWVDAPRVPPPQPANNAPGPQKKKKKTKERQDGGENGQHANTGDENGQNVNKVFQTGSSGSQENLKNMVGPRKDVATQTLGAVLGDRTGEFVNRKVRSANEEMLITPEKIVEDSVVKDNLLVEKEEAAQLGDLQEQLLIADVLSNSTKNMLRTSSTAFLSQFSPSEARLDDARRESLLRKSLTAKLHTFGPAREHRFGPLDPNPFGADFPRLLGLRGDDFIATKTWDFPSDFQLSFPLAEKTGTWLQVTCRGAEESPLVFSNPVGGTYSWSRWRPAAIVRLHFNISQKSIGVETFRDNPDKPGEYLSNVEVPEDLVFKECPMGFKIQYQVRSRVFSLDDDHNPVEESSSAAEARVQHFYDNFGEPVKMGIHDDVISTKPLTEEDLFGKKYLQMLRDAQE